MLYRKEIDGLRALAVIPVILFHGGFTWFSGGYVGVDVFFVISGFVISISAKNLAFQPTHFILYRLVRIVPFYWLMSLPLAVFYIHTGVWNWNSFLNTLFFIPVFDEIIYTNPLHWLGWSLSFEFWFYCLLALLMSIFKKNALIVLPAFLFVMCLLTLLFYHFDYYLPKFLFSPLTLEFSMGVLIYFISSKLHYKSLVVSGMISVILGMIILTKFNNFEGHMDSLTNSLFALKRTLLWGGFAASIVIFFIAIDNVKFYTFGSIATLLGRSSFSLYLIQPYCILLSTKVFNLTSLQSGMLYIVSVIFFGIILSKFVELPLLKLSKDFLRQKKYVPF